MKKLIRTYVVLFQPDVRAVPFWFKQLDEAGGRREAAQEAGEREKQEKQEEEAKWRRAVAFN